MESVLVYEIGNVQDIYEEYVVMAEYKTDDLEYYICKYCGETDKEKFKSRAHLIPEFAGNKEWFCFNECDNCNNSFSVYEYNLKNFGAFKNTFLPIKGKKKFPKYIDGYHDYSFQFKDDNSLMMNFTNENDFFKIENDKLRIKSLTLPFVPLYVYKCLTKIAFSLMKIEDFKKFENDIAWLKDKKNQKEHTISHLMLFNPNNNQPVSKPIAILLKKKKDYNCPEFSLVFFWGFLKFQIFLPFNSSDKDLNYCDLKLPILSDFLMQNENNEYKISHYNMNNLERIQSFEKLSFNFKTK